VKPTCPCNRGDAPSVSIETLYRSDEHPRQSSISTAAFARPPRPNDTLLTLAERRKWEADSENDHKSDPPHGYLWEDGWAGV
jgi:hypothetical protein